MVSLKCNIRVKAIKKLIIKGLGTHFADEYSSCFVRDKYLQAKRVPRPLISEFLYHLHSCETTLHFERYCIFVMDTAGHCFGKSPKLCDLKKNTNITKESQLCASSHRYSREMNLIFYI